METKFDNTFNYFDLQSISKLNNKSEADQDEKLKVVAQQLESVFLELVLKSMHEANASIKSELYDRDNEYFYQEMLNQQMSLSLAKAGGIGLAEVIVQQLKPKNENHLPVSQERLTKNVKENHVGVLQTTQQIENNNDFFEMLMPFAEKAAQMIGIDPKLLLAQSALETGWGKHIVQQDNGASSHNLFGIKSFDKSETNKVSALTREYEQNQPHVEKAPFRTYSSYMDSFKDFVQLIKSRRYEKALANVEDPKSFLSELHQAGYATDPDYVNKILSIYNKFTGS